MRKRPFLLGLTGSIGTGKSTTAQMFAAEGVPVWDADAVVHQLYETGEELLGGLVPMAIADGAVDREALRQLILEDPTLLAKIEAIIHPLVAENRVDFVKKNITAPLLVLEVPLLFETGVEASFDGVVVVTCSPEEQYRRVLARPGMTPSMFALILAKQMPDNEKRRRADYVIDTSLGMDATRTQVHALTQKLQRENNHA